ncbi:uncharacterized protein LOC130171086 [Seriola aureovittata]|uniref:uncharacterized protein LOC130171086 n=1 Tax=Seriola aureovittata TaxID=2871759 RepID=UPI0024BE8877|nr:uncharacterized protein LOC130171086 [Seriola aureovittata]
MLSPPVLRRLSERFEADTIRAGGNSTSTWSDDRKWGNDTSRAARPSPPFPIRGKKTLRTRHQSASTSRMDLKCFSAANPAAENASLLYSLKNDHVNYWVRNNPNIPLPICSSLTPTDSTCQVCLKEKVFVACRNLTDSIGVVMEVDGLGFPVDLEKSECPTLSEDLPPWRLLLIIIVFLILIAICSVLCYKYNKGCKSPNGEQPEECEEGASAHLTEGSA